MTNELAKPADECAVEDWEQSDPRRTAEAVYGCRCQRCQAKKTERAQWMGPRTRSVTTCEGCPALKTERWTEYLENDETDSGTWARCTAKGEPGENIGPYWHSTDPVPVWCPAAKPAAA